MNIRPKFIDLVSFDVRLCLDTRLWEDSWCGSPPLKDKFCRIFSIAFEPLGLVADNYDHSGGRN